MSDLEIGLSSDLKIAIALLELRGGDVLVVKSPPMSHAVQAMANETLRAIIPSGVRILFIPLEVELSVLTKADIDAPVAA